jgi:hypothetical protein
MWLGARRTIEGLLSGVLEEVMGHKISQFLNSVIAADLRRRSHRPYSAHVLGSVA